MSKAALSTREKYDCNARRYGVMEFFPESLFFGTWRKDLFSRITGASLVELGVGTGKNLPYHPKGAPCHGDRFQRGDVETRGAELQSSGFRWT